MIWVIAILAIFIVGSIIGCLRIGMQARKHSSKSKASSGFLQDELIKKEEIVAELRGLIGGLVTPSIVDEKKREATLLEDTLKTERGKLAIAKAEIDNLLVRVRELDEVQQELEASSLESAHELDMLKTQERSLAQKSSELKEELEKSLQQLDKLLDELANSQEAVEKLAKTKTELLAAQEKIAWYEQKITEINENYMELKKAYDALDIEYAQLYEKQQMR